MDDVEAAEVVALTLALDPYGYGDQTETSINVMIDAWTLALPDVDANLAKRAVIAHYRRTSKRISIADIIEGSSEIAAMDRAGQRHEALMTRRRDDQAALPPAPPVRDRTLDIARLLAEHRNWDPVGDLATRRKRASWSPRLEEAYQRATRAKAAQGREKAAGDTPE